MEKLKSRKLWMALLAAILPVINTDFGLGLDTNSVLAVIGVIATYIIGQSHVDAKQAALPQPQPAPLSDPNKFIQG